jgi:tripartite-type tricarboxylate transporter receptor subunit TctC
MTHVPYRSGLGAVQDLMAGQVAAVMVDLPTIVQHVQAGKLKLLAVTAAGRVMQFPNAPTFSESGYPGFTGGTWFAAYVPTGTPPLIAQQLSNHLKAALQAPRVSNWLNEVSMTAAHLPPSETKLESQQLARRYEKIIKVLNIPPQ